MTYEQILDEIRQLPVSQRKQLMRDMVDLMVEQPSQPKQRIAGLHAGQGWVSDDFDNELPDSFWLGEE